MIFLNFLGKMKRAGRVKGPNQKGWYTAQCPAHKDRRPSLSFKENKNGGVIVKCHAGCSRQEIMRALGYTENNKATANISTNRCANRKPLTIVDLSLNKKIPPDDLVTYGLEDTPRGVRICYFEMDGTRALRHRIRTALVAKEGSFWNGKDGEILPYGLRYLHDAQEQKFIIICEGESDCWTLWHHGFPALGIPGAQMAKVLKAEHLHGIHRIFTFVENDEAGQTFKENLTQLFAELKMNETAQIFFFSLPELNDLNDLHRENSIKFKENLQKALASAERLRPPVLLQGYTQTITKTAMTLGMLLAREQRMFSRGGTIVEIEKSKKDGVKLKPIGPIELTSEFEQVGQLYCMNSKGEVTPAVCSKSKADQVFHCRYFRNQLDEIKIITTCPVFIERDGRLLQIVGFDQGSGIFAAGNEAPIVSTMAAVENLRMLIRDFNFASDGDRARALAAFITPALIFGGLLNGRAPVDLGEANLSQSGKGFRNKLTAALYNETVAIVNQRKRGVGGLEEGFAEILIQGRPFISLDNLRGKIDIPSIESFLTEDAFYARAPYSKRVKIDPRRVFVQMTSNRVDITEDLANRSSCVRILKQLKGYPFQKFPEGDILDHVRKNQPRYLGSIFSIIQSWYLAGKPKTNEIRHDFRVWAQTLDWITKNILDAGPLLADHDEARSRMTIPHLNWLRDVSLAVVSAAENGKWLRVHQILSVLEAADSIDIPGVNPDADLSNEKNWKKALQGIGRRFAMCFKANSFLKVDSVDIQRDEQRDKNQYKTVHLYMFRKTGTHPPEPPIPPEESENSDDFKREFD